MAREPQGLGTVGQALYANVGLLKLGFDLVDRGFHPVDPQVDRRGMVQPFTELGRVIGAKLIEINLHDPIGEAGLETDLGGQVGGCGEGLVGGTIVLPQQAIDESGQTAETIGFRQIHCGVDGGGAGDMVEVAQLVESDVEDESEFGGLLVGGFGGELVDQGVEGALAADDAVGQFGGETPIKARNIASFEGAIEGNVGEGTALDLLQGLEGEFAGGGGGCLGLASWEICHGEFLRFVGEFVEV